MTTTTSKDTAKASVDEAEVARFAANAHLWWDPSGPYAPLHALTPVRVTFVRDETTRHFSRDPLVLRCLDGLTLLDVGCGGGILAEPLSRLGAKVTAIDPAEKNVAAARAHAGEAGLAIDYRAETAEALLAAGESFDVVVASEVIEHVTDPGAFVKTLAGLTKPGGIVMLSTLNRTLKSFGLAIIGAEYILRWLPRGTHDWEKFVTPDEMAHYARGAGLVPGNRRGMIYNPLKREWNLGADTDVNYWFAADKSEG
ncbi:bifunctional 2-polyprenyl-6-hydroxyphenol methylase/3-demethylubiquinol 3-O-methyltransferase UbiG [Agaricicola taiwanensis]|nr:bifunctional 2-polyprenyl-6-hydroxyphenol methylase/3-demethylubiquinol 3-O-methyltransferase UbiG [Agaricicola taiwanensis]